MIFLVYLGSIMIPFVVLIIPLYQFMVAIGWVDRVPALILPWIFTAYGTFLMRQFFITIPRELEEAAFVDGASRWTILWRIFVPLSLPAIATQVTFSFLYSWNSFVWPQVILQSEQKFTLPMALAKYDRVFFATHVPPLREACWHEGRISDDHWSPHFTCLAMGQALLEVMRDFPAKQLTVLCGHTHGAGECRPAPNIEILTGGAIYGVPELVRTFEV